MRQAKFMILVKLADDEVVFAPARKAKEIAELEEVFDKANGEEFKVFALNDNNTYALTYAKHNRKIGF